MKGNCCGIFSPMTVFRQIMKFSIICFIVVSILFSDVTHGSSDHKKVTSLKRDKRNAQSQNPPDNSDLSNILEQYATNHGDVNLLQYTPTTPRPEDVNCHVEVPMTRRVGGRCVQLGSHTMGCQAGIHLAFSSECYSNAHRAFHPRSSPRMRGRNPFRQRIEALRRRPAQ